MQLPMGLSPATSALSVTQLNRLIRDTLDAALDEVWVVGEISNFRTPASGHFYFALKDDRCQLSAVMFRSANQLLPFKPEDGMSVLVRARVGIYDVRGDLQLYVDGMEPRGVGSMQLALEQLKQRLAAEGLFAEERKRPLPEMPSCLGIVTALSGAAVHDMLVVLGHRMPSTRVVIRPVRVQGREAPPDIVQAIADLADVGDVDVIIVGRGGGSLEDLWAFNDERVVRAIAASPIPVVSAVGHEVDITLADLVADRRAPTPTAAAALVVPDRADLLASLQSNGLSLQRSLQRRLRQERERLSATARRLRDPRQSLKLARLRLDELAERAARATRLRLDRERQRLVASGDRLHALSPLAVLDRGYSLTTHAASGRIVRDTAQLAVGDDLEIRLARGQVSARVQATRP